MEQVEFRPQPGPQTDFLSTEADIAFYGGAAGGGKTFSLILDPLRHLENPLFKGVIFRRESTMITTPGGLWDESNNVYPNFATDRPNISRREWTFPSGMSMSFAHLNQESDKLAWQGAQLPWIGFDEVTHFTITQFFYMLSRLRSVSGVPSCVRATCNPDPDSWVAQFISWWIDQDTGFPIPERSGKLRWFIRQGDEFVWADSRQELIDKYGETQLPKSVTFIPAKLSDNQILMQKDPTYLSNLHALSRVDRGRLLDGNWKVRAVAGELFQSGWFPIVRSVPPNIVKRVRYWDRAATEPSEKNPNPDWTAGVKISMDGNGMFYVEHVERFRGRPLAVKMRIKKIAESDGMGCKQILEKDPGQAGVAEIDDLVAFLRGHIVGVAQVTKDKVTRAKPASSQAERRHIHLVEGDWNKAFLDELEAFPSDNVKDDQVDGLSGGFNELSGKTNVLALMTTM